MPLVDNLLSHYQMDRLELIWKADSLPCLMYISPVVVKHVPQVPWKCDGPGPEQEPIQRTCRVWWRLRACLSIVIANDCCSQSSDSLNLCAFVRMHFFTGITAVAASRKEKWAAANWKWGHKYFWQFSRRGNVFQTRPFSFLVVPKRLDTGLLAHMESSVHNRRNHGDMEKGFHL